MTLKHLTSGALFELDGKEYIVTNKGRDVIGLVKNEHYKLCVSIHTGELVEFAEEIKVKAID